MAWMNRMTAQALLAAEEGNEEWFHTVLESVEPHVERAEQTPIIVLAEIHMARMAHGCEAGLGVLRRRLPQIEAIFHTTPYMRATLVATRADLATYLGGYAGARHMLERLPKEHPSYGSQPRVWNYTAVITTRLARSPSGYLERTSPCGAVQKSD